MDEWEIDQGKLLESTKRYEAHVELLETLRAEADEYESKIAVKSLVFLKQYQQLIKTKWN